MWERWRHAGGGWEGVGRRLGSCLSTQSGAGGGGASTWANNFSYCTPFLRSSTEFFHILETDDPASGICFLCAWIEKLEKTSFGISHEKQPSGWTEHPLLHFSTWRHSQLRVGEWEKEGGEGGEGKGQGGDQAGGGEWGICIWWEIKRNFIDEDDPSRGLEWEKCGFKISHREKGFWQQVPGSLARNPRLDFIFEIHEEGMCVRVERKMVKVSWGQTDISGPILWAGRRANGKSPTGGSFLYCSRGNKSTVLSPTTKKLGIASSSLCWGIPTFRPREKFGWHSLDPWQLQLVLASLEGFWWRSKMWKRHDFTLGSGVLTFPA